MNECVMAIYGVTRLLKSRDLGPAQLIPAIQSFREEVERHCVSVEPLFAGLRAAAAERGALSDAVAALEPAARRVAESIIKSFSGNLKLGARQRLRMEREAERLGAELEAVRGLADALHAALSARPVYVTLADLLHGRWYSRPTFAVQRVAVLLGDGVNHGFMAEPRVVRALLDHLFRSFAAEGHARLVVHANERVDDVELEVAPNGDRPDSVDLDIGASLNVELDVLGPAGRLLGLNMSEQEGRRLLTLPS